MSSEDQIEQAMGLITAGHSQRAAAAKVGIAESTLRYHLNGRQRSRPEEGAVISGDTAVLTSAIGQITNPERLMAEMGFSTDDWTIADDPIVNRWGGVDDPSYQLKLRLRQRNGVEFVMPAVHVPPIERTPVEPAPGEPRLVAIVADQQAPYHCEEAHELFLKWLDEHRPHEVVLAGDLIDLPDISRHKDNPEWHVPVQTCVNTGYRLLRDYVEHAPQAKFTKLIGNHDERIRNELLLRAERLYGVTPAPTEECPNPTAAMSVRNLLHLDALGVELVEPDGNYTHAQHWLAPDLAVRHGWLTGANTAEKSLKNVDFSMIVFHTHNQAVVQKTTHTRYGTRQQFGVVGGAMCKVTGGIGYAVDPNWQRGFVTARIWPSGDFQIDLANIHNGAVTWNGTRLEIAV